MNAWRYGLWWLTLLATASGFVLSTSGLNDYPRVRAQAEMQVALPLFIQVALAGGDRYLAADIAVVRSLIVSTEQMDADSYAILGRVQDDASWLNPAHEDNYYIAAAILPWNGEVKPSQSILKRATLSRPFDYQPPFYYAFNQAHFLGDVVGASRWLAKAATSLPDEDERLLMQNLAARMMDRASDLDLAISIVESLAKQSRREDFKAYLLLRVERLRTLKALRLAAKQYEVRMQTLPTQLQQLIDSGMIKEIPKDPLGFGYAIQPDGTIVLLNASPR